MWVYITAISSVLLVALLGLAVFCPLRITITTDEPPERTNRGKPRRHAKRTRKKTYDDELYLDDSEL